MGCRARACKCHATARTPTAAVPVKASERLSSARFALVVVERALLLHRARDAHAGAAAATSRSRWGTGSVAVGIAVGAFAVGAVVLRAYAGWLGDSLGRRVLIVGGALIVGVSVACYGLVHALWYLVAAARRHRVRRGGVLRRRGHDDHRPRAGRTAGRGGELLVGRGLRRALVRPGARRRALRSDARRSSRALRAGMGGVGPARVRRSRARHVHGRGRAAAVVAEGTRTSFTAPRSSPAACCSSGSSRWRASRRSSRSTSTELHVSAGPIFADVRRADSRRAHARRAGARPHRRAKPPERSRWRSLRSVSERSRRGRPSRVWSSGPRVRGRHVAHVSRVAPARARRRHDSDRASVVGTFSSFFDASQGVGAFICGAVVAVVGNRGAFTTGAVCAAAGLVLLRARARSSGQVAFFVPSLLVTNDFPPKHGGIQSYLCELWRRLPPDETTVLTTAFPDAASWDAQQAFRIERVRERVLLPTPDLVRRIDALAREVGADVIFLDPMLPLGLAGPRLLRRALRRGRARERDHRVRADARKPTVGSTRACAARRRSWRPVRIRRAPRPTPPAARWPAS